ncbi:glycosyltransferase family 2 protein [Stakelama sediminis]|uniref:Glycosyltransferase involved in cell wall biosynthesis n=1 Tax=Stakelama sediminis TaxID=463200 RepID=A0A840YZS4_9SPHN|nr:glycosyltransferase family 2 protein [Stakelama sediminis]MBB5719208.1 glycosyltransferase involved in cell wall biosynthesis [Stakelama sediminis]
MTAAQALRQDIVNDGSTPPNPSPVELSIVMPCLNEAETIAICIKKAKAFLDRHGVAGEIIIADNGSVDGSQQIANALGARIVHVEAKGYGAALIGGIREAHGRYVAMGDADDSYDFEGLMPFVEQLRDGADLVMGNRFRGGIEKGAMPPLHRYLGNPVLSFIGRTFFATPIRDFHCGLRAFRRDRVTELGLTSPGMEFASEMVVRAAIDGFDIREVPTTLKPDGRSRAPHLRTWRDGWRHLRFLLIYAPRFLFLYPGLALLFAGLATMLALIPGDLQLGSLQFGIHTMIFGVMAAIMGSQCIGLAVMARRYGAIAGMWPESGLMRRVRNWFSVERACVLGGLMLAMGIGGAILATSIWAAHGFGNMQPTALMRVTIPSVFLSCVGLQMVLTAFFIGLLDQPGRR